MNFFKRRYVIHLYKRGKSDLLSPRAEFLAEQIAGPVAWHFEKDRAPYLVQGLLLDCALKRYEEKG